MKNFFKWVGIVLGIIIIIAVAVAVVIHEPLPEGESGEAADALAQKMLAAINDSAWQETEFVAWTFPGGHHYVWDKNRHWVEVKWGSNRVLLKINSKQGRVWRKDKEITEAEKKTSLLNQAWEYWVNDSFWLNAPAKVFDSGTKRYKIVTERGEKALLVTYEQGGATPGDSYMWILDENYLPESWKLWVKIIPIGGLTFTWEDWITLGTGAKIATLHKSGLISLRITNVKGATQIDKIKEGKDIFSPLETEISLKK